MKILHTLDFTHLKKKIEKPTIEVMDMFLPIGFIVAAIFEIALKFKIDKIQLFTLNIVGDFISLNSLHTILTVSFFVNNVEFKNYMRSKSEEIGYPLAYKWGLVYLAFLLMSCVVFFYSSYNFSQISFAVAITVGVYLFRINHSASQSVGVSLLNYSKWNHTGIENNMLKQKCMFLERSFFYIIMGFQIFTFLNIIFFKFDIRYTLILSSLVSILIFNLSIFLLTNQVDSEFARSRFIYNCRYFLYPLSVLSHVSFAGISVIHGTEYLLVNKKVNNQGFSFSLSKQNITLLCFMVLLAISSIITIYYFHNQQQIPNGYFWIFFIGYVFFQSVSFFHFYVDGLIFKFKDKVVQTHIAPLFFENKNKFTQSVMKKSV